MRHPPKKIDEHVPVIRLTYHTKTAMPDKCKICGNPPITPRHSYCVKCHPDNNNSSHGNSSGKPAKATDSSTKTKATTSPTSTVTKSCKSCSKPAMSNRHSYCVKCHPDNNKDKDKNNSGGGGKVSATAAKSTGTVSSVSTKTCATCGKAPTISNRHKYCTGCHPDNNIKKSTSGGKGGAAATMAPASSSSVSDKTCATCGRAPTISNRHKYCTGCHPDNNNNNNNKAATSRPKAPSTPSTTHKTIIRRRSHDSSVQCHAICSSNGEICHNPLAAKGGRFCAYHADNRPKYAITTVR